MLNLKFLKNRFTKNPPDYYHQINQLSLHERVFLKQRLAESALLDYADKEIYMVANTVPEWGRLQSCKKEPETIRWLEETIKPDDVFYDIGANVGAYSLLAAALTEAKSHIYAFEPSFSSFSTLNQNIHLNQYSNCIIPLQIALNDTTGLTALHYSNILPGTAMHGLEHPVAEEGHPFEPIYTQTILSYTLDDFVKQFSIKDPNLIKIDVDGAELRVIQGAENVLSKPSLRSLLIELNEEHSVYSPIIEMIQSKGFSLSSKHQRGDSRYFNYIYNR